MQSIRTLTLMLFIFFQKLPCGLAVHGYTVQSKCFGGELVVRCAIRIALTNSSTTLAAADMSHQGDCLKNKAVLTRPPLPSNRHHRRCGDCLEGKGGNYQVCSVQYCVQQLCTVRCTHIRTD